MTQEFGDDPLFKSSKGALLFALNYTHGGIKSPSIVALMKDAGGKKGRGLGGLDGAAQAGMIQVELGRLSELRRAILVARYAVPSLPCSCRAPCCRGYRDNPEWDEAISWLAVYVLDKKLTGSISHHTFRKKLVARHFGSKESFIRIASECRVHRQTASESYKAIHAHLKEVEEVARLEIDGILQAGMVVE